MQDIFVMAMAGLIGVSLFVIAYEIYIDVSFKKFCNILQRMINEHSNKHRDLLIEISSLKTNVNNISNKLMSKNKKRS